MEWETIGLLVVAGSVLLTSIAIKIFFEKEPRISFLKILGVYVCSATFSVVLSTTLVHLFPQVVM